MKIIILCLLLIPIFSKGQSKVDFNQGNIKQVSFNDTIPFEYIREKIIVNITIKDKKRRFIFDTGATLIISEELQSEMQNPIIDSVKQMDAFGSRVTKLAVIVNEFSLNRITFQNIPSIVSNFKDAGALSCLNFDGIIGSNAFRNCIVQIDLNNKYLILTNDISKIDTKNSFSTKMELDKQSGPHLTVKIGNKLNITALFDSGSDEFMAISNDMYSKIKNKNLCQLLNEGIGATTFGIQGSEKAQSKQRISINSVDFGNNIIQNIVTVISKGYTENAFGLGLAKYGIITLDYIHKTFYFLPNQTIQTFKSQTTLGFVPYPEKDYYKIGLVWSNTKAEKMGLSYGFQILKINDLDLSIRTDKTDCELFLAQPFKQSVMNLTYKDEKNNIKTTTLVQE